MSIKKGNINISNIRKGSNEIGKAYLGDKLVFNHDAPVWMLRNNAGVYYSLDGENYAKIANGLSANDVPESSCYCNGKFIFSRGGPSGANNKLYAYDLNQLRKGILSEQIINPGTTYEAGNVASDGDMCIITCSSGTSSRSTRYLFALLIRWRRYLE